MRTPFRWTLTLQTSLQILWVSGALLGTPVAALAAPEQIAPPPPVTTTPVSAATSSIADNSTAHVGGVSVDRRVLTLLAMGCLVGMIVGWARGGPRETRLRLINKPKKTRLSVLVPPGPSPRLIPSDSPNATRARWTPASVSRQTPAGATLPVIDYIAAFAGSGTAEASEDQVDYLLVSGDSVGEE